VRLSRLVCLAIAILGLSIIGAPLVKSAADWLLRTFPGTSPLFDFDENTGIYDFGRVYRRLLLALTLFVGYFGRSWLGLIPLRKIPFDNRPARQLGSGWALGCLTFAFFLQAQVQDLRGDNDRLVSQVADAGQTLAQQQEIMAVLAAPDVQQVRLEATDPGSEAFGVYNWSAATRTGALLCKNLPPLEPGQVYKVWLLTEDESIGVASFQDWDGVGQLSMSLESIRKRPVGIGMSIEDTADAAEPGEIFLYADFEQ